MILKGNFLTFFLLKGILGYFGREAMLNHHYEQIGLIPRSYLAKNSLYQYAILFIKLAAFSNSHAIKISPVRTLILRKSLVKPFFIFSYSNDFFVYFWKRLWNSSSSSPFKQEFLLKLARVALFWITDYFRFWKYFRFWNKSPRFWLCFNC